jgi:hypothetical protein
MVVDDIGSAEEQVLLLSESDKVGAAACAAKTQFNVGCGNSVHWLDLPKGNSLAKGSSTGYRALLQFMQFSNVSISLTTVFTLQSH